MWMLNSGQTRILVCTDVCGMGLNITCVLRVFQWKVLEVLCLKTLNQREGRGGRDPSTQAVVRPVDTHKTRCGRDFGCAVGEIRHVPSKFVVNLARYEGYCAK